MTLYSCGTTAQTWLRDLYNRVPWVTAMTTDIPVDVVPTILSFANTTDIPNCALVCRDWNRFSYSNEVWLHRIEECKVPFTVPSFESYERNHKESEEDRLAFYYYLYRKREARSMLNRYEYENEISYITHYSQERRNSCCDHVLVRCFPDW
jgi:hypothetical protein